MIKFHPVARKNPTTKAIKYYPAVAKTQPVDLVDVATDITAFCTVTEPDVIAVLRALQKVMYNHLSQGHSVRLGAVGSFRITLKSLKGQDSADKVTADDIRSARFVYTPSAWLQRQRAALKYAKE